jgi:hypothetical protein
MDCIWPGQDSARTIAATLLLDGPGVDIVYEQMLGQAAAISCVGVAPTCHIGWTVCESFYTRAGYRPWRRYCMFRTATSPQWPPAPDRPA